MDAAQAEQIVAYRETALINGVVDIAGIIGGTNTLLAPYVNGQTDKVLTCTIEAAGYRDLKKNGYSITATVVMEGPQKYRYLYYRSPSGNI